MSAPFFTKLAGLQDKDPESVQVAVQKYFRLPYLPAFDPTRYLVLKLSAGQSYGEILNAAIRHHKGAARLLIDIGIEEKDLNEALTRLLDKEEKADLPMIKMLLDAKADPSSEDGSPLAYATYHGHSEVVKLLLQRGAVISDAAMENVFGDEHNEIDYEILEMLLEAKATPKGWMLRDAINKGDLKIAELLLQHGVEPEEALVEAQERAEEGGEETKYLDLLLKQGVSLTQEEIENPIIAERLAALGL
jgi:hypothetical protein